MEIPITQSKVWQKLQDDLGLTSFYREAEAYQFLAIKKTTPLGPYLYLPYGPVAQTAAAFTAALQAITALAREENCLFIRLEPQNPDFVSLLPRTAQKSHDLNPKETWLLDLTGSEADLDSRLPSRLCRYYRNAAKNGLRVETSHRPDDIHYLLDLQKALAKSKNINTFSEAYLKTELRQSFATLYLVKYQAPATSQAAQAPATSQENIVAAGLVFDHDKTRYNLQGAQSEQGRKLHATGILTIQLIKDARKKGLELFDFWGIAPEGAGPDHPWAGFTNFKKTFAGTEKVYAGTYDLILKPLPYKSYQILRKIRRMV